MARGDHPMRTPVYGGLLIAAAMIGSTLVVAYGGSWPGWTRAVVLTVAVVAILAGALLTLRDRTPPRRPRR
jgi:UDP-N-acetylmuramyl pentapeptide phosphotransferase/UDP-N-acetylglucosamine-1-phosphate transferase